VALIAANDRSFWAVVRHLAVFAGGCAAKMAVAMSRYNGIGESFVLVRTRFFATGADADQTEPL